MTAYYNEIDAYAAQWLRNLIAAGQIAAGDVDERSIQDVSADDLRGYSQAHFFAGIGGWSVALRLAGWPDDRPVWTGSCPCQPFSAAGAGKAADDKRHLWPAWFPLIAKCRPPVVFGEQVEAAVGWGWVDAVFADLEAEGYACGTAVLPACGIGAPHIRQRLWFVGHAALDGSRSFDGQPGASAGEQESARGSGISSELADADRGGRSGAEIHLPERGPQQAIPDASRPSGALRMADFGIGETRECGDCRGHGRVLKSGSIAGTITCRSCGGTGRMEHAESEQAGIPGRPRQPGGSYWAALEWLPCTDGKARPVEPGTFPLAHGIQRRTSKLRAYGNAIVPQVAAEFIRAVRT